MARLPPDLGADSALARYLREAHQMLGDPELRAAYDRALGLEPPKSPEPAPNDNAELLAFLEKEARGARTRRYAGCFVAMLPALFILVLILVSLGQH